MPVELDESAPTAQRSNVARAPSKANLHGDPYPTQNRRSAITPGDPGHHPSHAMMASIGAGREGVGKNPPRGPPDIPSRHQYPDTPPLRAGPSQTINTG